MSSSARYLNPSEAAERLGISQKALRLYEKRGLLAPNRTSAGWRAYSPAEMTRATEIVALRALGLSLAQVERVLSGDPQSLAPALAAHQQKLEAEIRRLSMAVGSVRNLRTNLDNGHPPRMQELSRLAGPTTDALVAFDLPWPWGGERFELRDVKSLNYIIGPLGSGKTRLAKAIAETLPDALFIDLERSADQGAAARLRMEADRELNARVERATGWLLEEGATMSSHLITLIAALEENHNRIAVIDMIEQGLDQETQEAMIAHLRRRGAGARPIFMLTRSSAILDLAEVGPDETITLCPANHSPPMRVVPFAGAPGYEAVATCLASPDVRARTEGVIAFRPQTA